MTQDGVELSFIREFSHSGNNIAKSPDKAARRERVRVGILKDGRAMIRFEDTDMTYGEAFQFVYGERLDRRAAMRTLPDPDYQGEGDDEDDEEEHA